MKIQLLSGGGAYDLQQQYLTSFVIDGELAVDAGALPLALSRSNQLCIRNIIITHSHLDHLVGLPLMLDNIFTEMEHTIRVYAIEETVEALRNHIFNNDIWPDFSSFKNSHGVNLQFEVIEPRQTLEIGRLRVKAIPVNHTVPTAGLIVEDGRVAIAISSDTCETDELWMVARSTVNLRAAFIECSYPNRLSHLAAKYGHLSPQSMLEQARKIGRRVPVYAYHIKPAQMAEVLDELEQLRNEGIAPAVANYIYEF
ncbi:MAG: 3',5'-cyclic-nucleotide phosphodiesterase [Acidobacteriota bacterium]